MPCVPAEFKFFLYSRSSRHDISVLARGPGPASAFGALLAMLFSGLVLAQEIVEPAAGSPAAGSPAAGSSRGSSPALQQEVEHSSSIAPNGIEEPCFFLEKRGRLEFNFTSDANLEFNIHYHDDRVYFPVKFEAIRQKEGTYFAPEARQYCLMWTNRQPDPVQIEYQFQVFAREMPQ